MSPYEPVNEPAQRERRSDAQKVLETIASVRCPCGHLEQRHRKATGALPGEKWGDCRDCDCRGLVDWTDDDRLVEIKGRFDPA